MTDRINAITIVLERDTRADDIEPLVAAIQQLKGVLSVTAEPVSSISYIANSRAKNEILNKIIGTCRELSMSEIDIKY